MKKKVAFLTTIFPMNEEFLDEFFHSLSNQTYKEFDIVIINDGYEFLEKLKTKYQSLSIIELPYSNTPAKNREFGINYVIDHGYDLLIFGDSDDCFADNRVEKSNGLLADYDIVVNDLSLFQNHEIYKNRYISNRLENKSEIKIDFIMDKNIFGLSNTAINLESMGKVVFDKDLIAVDWFFYSTLLMENKKAVFTNETTTYYRQYETNTIGLGTQSAESIKMGLAVKKKHYELLKDYNTDYLFMYNKIVNIVPNDEYCEDLNRFKQDTAINLLWWENIRLPGVLNAVNTK